MNKNYRLAIAIKKNTKFISVVFVSIRVGCKVVKTLSKEFSCICVTNIFVKFSMTVGTFKKIVSSYHNFHTL